MNPSQRVTELRNQGAEIDTAWTLEPSEAGRDPHRQARYVLLSHQGGGIDLELVGLLVWLWYWAAADRGAAMIRALIVGELRADPQQRMGKNGKPYAPRGSPCRWAHQGRVSCSLIVFEAEAGDPAAATAGGRIGGGGGHAQGGRLRGQRQRKQGEPRHGGRRDRQHDPATEEAEASASIEATRAVAIRSMTMLIGWGRDHAHARHHPELPHRHARRWPDPA